MVLKNMQKKALKENDASFKLIKKNMGLFSFNLSQMSEFYIDKTS